MRSVPAFAVVGWSGELKPRGNGHEWQYPVFYKRNRPEGANGFLDRSDDLSDVRRVVIVDADLMADIRYLLEDIEDLAMQDRAAGMAIELLARLKGKADADDRRMSSR